MRRNFKGSVDRRKYVLNDRIQQATLRVIDATGKQIGLLAREDALRKAYESEQDLILISPNAVPPVAKIIDFNKFLYLENKRQKDSRRGIKKSQTKDIKLSLFIGTQDFERLVVKAKEFIEKGHQVRIGLLLKGREVSKQSMGFQIINSFISRVDNSIVASAARVQGRVISAIISKKK